MLERSKMGCAAAALGAALFATACGGTEVRSASLRQIEVADYRSVEDLHRTLARTGWQGAERGCSLFWGESPRLYWDVQPVLLRWNGSAWQVVDRGVYCDNGEVPAAIYQKACESN